MNDRRPAPEREKEPMKKILLVLAAVALAACGENTKTLTDRGGEVNVGVRVEVGRNSTPPMNNPNNPGNTQCDDSNWGAWIEFSDEIPLAWGMADCTGLKPHPRDRRQQSHQNPDKPNQDWEVDEILRPGMRIGGDSGVSGVHLWPTDPNVFGDGRGWFDGTFGERRHWCEVTLLEYIEWLWNSTDGDAAMPYFNGRTCSVSHDGRRS